MRLRRRTAALYLLAVLFAARRAFGSTGGWHGHSRRPWKNKTSGADILKVYQLGAQIGSGTFSVVRRSTRLDNPDIHVAVKSVDKRLLQSFIEVPEDPWREIGILEQLSEPWSELRHGSEHIMRLVDVFEDEDKVHIVSDLYTSENILDRAMR